MPLVQPEDHGLGSTAGKAMSWQDALTRVAARGSFVFVLMACVVDTCTIPHA